MARHPAPEAVAAPARRRVTMDERVRRRVTATTGEDRHCLARPPTLQARSGSATAS
jgi:hypothetical protein